jgi:hypothetical protein
MNPRDRRLRLRKSTVRNLTEGAAARVQGGKERTVIPQEDEDDDTVAGTCGATACGGTCGELTCHCTDTCPNATCLFTYCDLNACLSEYIC